MQKCVYQSSIFFSRSISSPLLIFRLPVVHIYTHIYMSQLCFCYSCNATTTNGLYYRALAAFAVKFVYVCTDLKLLFILSRTYVYLYVYVMHIHVYIKEMKIESTAAFSFESQITTTRRSYSSFLLHLSPENFTVKK